MIYADLTRCQRCLRFSHSLVHFSAFGLHSNGSLIGSFTASHSCISGNGFGNKKDMATVLPSQQGSGFIFHFKFDDSGRRTEFTSRIIFLVSSSGCGLDIQTKSPFLIDCDLDNGSTVTTD
jgi:hypothetical protein